MPSLGSADRQLLISRLERAIDPELAGLSEEDEGVLDTALDLLRQVRIQAEVERQAQRAAIAQLESLVASQQCGSDGKSFDVSSACKKSQGSRMVRLKRLCV